TARKRGLWLRPSPRAWASHGVSGTVRTRSRPFHGPPAPAVIAEPLQAHWRNSRARFVTRSAPLLALAHALARSSPNDGMHERARTERADEGGDPAGQAEVESRPLQLVDVLAVEGHVLRVGGVGAVAVRLAAAALEREDGVLELRDLLAQAVEHAERVDLCAEGERVLVVDYD